MAPQPIYTRKLSDEMEFAGRLKVPAFQRSAFLTGDVPPALLSRKRYERAAESRLSGRRHPISPAMRRTQRCSLHSSRLPWPHPSTAPCANIAPTIIAGHQDQIPWRRLLGRLPATSRLGGFWELAAPPRGASRRCWRRKNLGTAPDIGAARVQGATRPMLRYWHDEMCIRSGQTCHGAGALRR
jgi:hypothetical protein